MRTPAKVHLSFRPEVRILPGAPLKAHNTKNLRVTDRSPFLISGISQGALHFQCVAHPEQGGRSPDRIEDQTRDWPPRWNISSFRRLFLPLLRQGMLS